MSFCKDFYGDREFLVKIYLESDSFDFESLCVLSENELDILYCLKENNTDFITISDDTTSSEELVSFKVNDFSVLDEELDSRYLTNQNMIKSWLKDFDYYEFEEFITYYGGSYSTKYLFEMGELFEEKNTGLYISFRNGAEICIVKDVSDEEYKILEILKRKNVKFNNQYYIIDYYKSISGVEPDWVYDDIYKELMENYKGLSNPETLKDSLEYFSIEYTELLNTPEECCKCNTVKNNLIKTDSLICGDCIVENIFN